MTLRQPDRLACNDYIDSLLANDPLYGFQVAEQVVQNLQGQEHLDRCVLAQAWARLGTAFRTIGDCARAEHAFETAEGLCGCTSCRPDRLRRMAYLRTCQGLPGHGIDLAHAAVEAFGQDPRGVGRARLALAYAELGAGHLERSLVTARQALAELPPDDLLYVTGALCYISTIALRISLDPPTLNQVLQELNQLRQRWPRAKRYRAARARVRMLRALIRDRLGLIRPADLRTTLRQVQRTLLDLGLIRDAVAVTAETAELCSSMRAEELAADTVYAMINALPDSLPRHLAMAVRKLRKSLQAINRTTICRAAADLREALILRPSTAF